jgi:hypothetical protein
VSSLSIDDHSQADDRFYQLIEVAYFGKDIPDSYDPISNLILNRVEPFDPDEMPWQSANVSDVATASTWNVWINLSPIDGTSEKGIAMDDLFTKDLSFFDSSDFKTEFTKIFFSISDNNLDTWAAIKPVTSIVKKQQEGAKRKVIDDPVALLGYEVFARPRSYRTCFFFFLYTLFMYSYLTVEVGRARA